MARRWRCRRRGLAPPGRWLPPARPSPPRTPGRPLPPGRGGPPRRWRRVGHRGTLAATVPANRKARWGRSRSGSTAPSCGEAAHAYPVHQHFPGGDVVEAGDQVHQGGLAAAGAAHDGGDLPGPGREGDAGEDRLVGARVAGTRTSRNSTVPRRAGAGPVVRGPRCWGRCRDFLDAVGRGRARGTATNINRGQQHPEKRMCIR